MKRLNVSIVALVSALAVPAQAQEIELDEIVVTANRTETARNRTGVSVSVVAKADLQRAGTSLKDALAREPGFSLASQGPFGNNANLTLRGAQGRYISVFVDGIRVDDPSSFTTSYEFGSMMSSGIGRIEVLRGSQSALWGSSAVAGVISVESPRAEQDGTQQEVTIEGGSYGSATLNYGLTQKTGDLELSLNASHVRTDGFSAASSAELDESGIVTPIPSSEADGAKADRLSVGLRYAINDDMVLGGNFFVKGLEQEFDDFSYSLYIPIDADKSQNTKEMGSRVFAELQTGNTKHIVTLSNYQIKRDYLRAGLADDSYEGERNRLDWTATIDVSDALTVVAGAEAVNEVANVYSGAATTIESVRTAGVFGQGLWAISSDIDLTGSLRRDHNENFGGFSTGGVALAWRPSSDLTLRAAAATGFRAPSLNELYADYSVATPSEDSWSFANNPDLRPETSESVEIGLEKTFANDATLSLTAFRLNVDNLVGNRCTVDLLPDDSCPSFSYILDNFAGKSVRKGVEISASLPVNNRGELSISYAYVDAKTASGGHIRGVARHNLNIGLSHDLGDRVMLDAGLRHVAGSTDVFTGQALKDFATVDLGASYAISETAEAYLRVQNVFDASYQEASGYNTSGRAAFVGLRATF
jgi:vitamin B12 transporter